MTVACLFTGLKVAEHPKHLKLVISNCEVYRFRTKSEQERHRCETDAVGGRRRQLGPSAAWPGLAWPGLACPPP
jgi:hypothetical protein